MMQLLIADDHPIFRNGLKQIIDDETGIEVKDEAADGRTVLSLLSKNTYDALILDIEMKGMSGLDVLKQVKLSYPKLPVLILSFYPEEQYAIRSLKLGAAGYLTKESAASELVAAVRRIVAGGKYITASVAERMVGILDDNFSGRPHERLSDREYQVFCKIAQGMGVGEISKELSLSPKTVSTYKMRIFEKMQLKGDAQVARYAIEEKLIK
jgi:two-component system invasion response regulator UvrY